MGILSVVFCMAAVLDSSCKTSNYQYKQNEAVTCGLLSRNSKAGYRVSSFRNFLHDQMRLIFSTCPEAAQKDIPNELLADHYSNTLFLVWQWAAVKHPNCTKEQAHQYLACLVGRV